MRISIGRYRFHLGLEERRGAEAEQDRPTRDLQDHELRMLRDAEGEHREHDWAARSLLSGNR